jgi:DNA-binding response OmpR family regulator
LKKILVVEDDPVNSQVLNDFLTANGYEVLVARTGPEGVTKFRDLQPDLAIIDVLLPSKNGFEVAFEIRQSPNGKDMPLLMMSAVYTDLDQAESYARDSLAAQGYLVKPFELSALMAKVRTLLGAA